MECPACALDVLVEDGKITQHLRPGDLTVCAGKAPQRTADHEPESGTPAKKPPAKKAAAKPHTAEK